jgi:hypothetical protein
MRLVRETKERVYSMERNSIRNKRGDRTARKPRVTQRQHTEKWEQLAAPTPVLWEEGNKKPQ